MVVCQALLGGVLVPGRALSDPARPCANRWSLRHRAGSPILTCPHHAQVGGHIQGHSTVVRVSESENSAIPFNLEQDYVECVVEAVQKDQDGHKVILKLVDNYKSGCNLAIQVYIGEFEKHSIGQGMKREAQHTTRPLTYDLMKTTVQTLGYEVTMVCVTNLLNSSYHARVVLAPASQHFAERTSPYYPTSIDARPSDAINLALRFRCPIYVKKEIARKMARPLEVLPPQTHSDIEKSCRTELRRYPDPTIVHKVNMQIAIAEERYADAASLRDTIERMFKADRALTLMVAIETALTDKRYEEAAYLRDEFKRVLAAQQAETVTA